MADLITLRDAAKQWGYSERTLHTLVRQHGLVRFRRPGDRRTWLDRQALERVLQPQPKTAPTQLKPLAAAIIPRGQRVLMTERRYPGYGEVWSWPSGKIEKNESLEEALLRELHEELLIDDANIVRHIGDIDLPSGYQMSHFLTTIPENVEPRLNDYEQLVQVQWMTRDEVERALATLSPHIAQRALQFVDEVLAAQPDLASAESRGDSISRPTLVAAIIANGDRVLMTQRRYSGNREMWSWPAGHLEEGERPEDAILRELNEELRISDATVVRHLGDVEYHGDVSQLWPKHGRFQHGYRMIHYQVALSSSGVEIIDHEELTRAEWLTLDQVRTAVASFPPELANAAVKFAREAISHARTTLPPRTA